MSLLLNTNDKCKISLLSIIYLSSPLMADEVLKSDGSREVEWGVKVLTGNEPLSKNSSDSNSYLFFMQKSVIGNVKTKKGYCSHLPNSNSYITSVGFSIENAYNVIYFNFGSDIMNAQPSGNTVNGLKEYLKSEYEKGTPVTVWYQLATPTSETISVSQIPTFKGNSVIDIDTEIQPKNMTVTYLGMEGTKQHTTFKLGNGDILKTQDNRQFCVI